MLPNKYNSPAVLNVLIRTILRRKIHSWLSRAPLTIRIRSLGFNHLHPHYIRLTLKRWKEKSPESCKVPLLRRSNRLLFPRSRFGFPGKCWLLKLMVLSQTILTWSSWTFPLQSDQRNRWCTVWFRLFLPSRTSCVPDLQLICVYFLLPTTFEICRGCCVFKNTTNIKFRLRRLILGVM
jgi:hypothetical protein